MERARNIEALFAESRVEEPRVTSEEVLQRLYRSIPSDKEVSTNNISSFKLLIMISSVSIVAISAMLFITNLGDGPTFNSDSPFNSLSTEGRGESPIDLRSDAATVIVEPSSGQNEIKYSNEEDSSTDNGEVQDDSTGLVTESNKRAASKEAHAYVRNGRAQYRSRRKSEFTKSDNIGRSRIFVISENTKTMQLERIKTQAEFAGIEFDYKTRNNGTVKRIEMILETAGSSSRVRLVVDKKDDSQFGWIVGNENRALRFYNRQTEIELATEAHEVNKDSIKKEVIDFERRLINESKEWIDRQ